MQHPRRVHVGRHPNDTAIEHALTTARDSALGQVDSAGNLPPGRTPIHLQRSCNQLISLVGHRFMGRHGHSFDCGTFQKSS